VNPADLAVIAITVVCLAREVSDYRVRMRVADRQRLVGPVKAPAPDKDAAEKSGRPSLRDAA
jgi:hypothetical protein